MAHPRRRHRPMSQINVVPYIDVMLVLLVIFMVTAPLLQTGVEVEVPEVEARPLEAQEQAAEPVVVNVDRQGRFFLGAARVEDAALGEKVRALLAERGQAQAYVRADHRVDYGRVMQAMVSLQQAGVKNIGLITKPPPEEEG